MNPYGALTIDHFDSEHLKNLDENGLPLLWPNREVQLLRLQVLTEIDELTGKSILDVGCGFCELLFLLKRQDCCVSRYTGVDLHSEIIRLLKERHPDVDARCADIIDIIWKSDSYDYCLGSGLFNMNMDGWRHRTSMILKNMFRISRLGIGVNFLRYRTENRNPVSYYARVDEVLEIMAELSNRYVIRGDYKQNDFTVYLYKNPL